MQAWGSWFVVAGLLLNTLGTYLAGSVAVAEWRKHRPGEPLLPRLDRAWRWFLRVVLRRPPPTVRASMGETLPGLTVEAHGMGHAVLSKDATLDEVVTYLRSAIGEVYSAIGEVQADARKRARQAHAHADAVRAELLETTSRVEDMARDIATGGVRRELRGLVLVGLGTILVALPSLPW